MLLYGIDMGDAVGYSQGWDFFETEDMLKNQVQEYKKEYRYKFQVENVFEIGSIKSLKERE